MLGIIGYALNYSEEAIKNEKKIITHFNNGGSIVCDGNISISNKQWKYENHHFINGLNEVQSYNCKGY